MKVPFEIPNKIDTQIARRHELVKSYINQEDIVFLFAFDYLSDEYRKNPVGVINAFREAFPKDPLCKLIIKSQCGTPDQIERLYKARGGDSRITIITETFSDKEMEILMNAMDVYVSLHSSEGLGLSIAEAILLEKPVVATKYSGNLDFCRAPWFIPVDYTMANVQEQSFYQSFFDKESPRWAKPDHADAVRALQQVRNNLDKYRIHATEGRAWILEQYHQGALAEVINKRIQEIFELL
jgi:glycosyltransferase involved in cell wall biosynthesis